MFFIIIKKIEREKERFCFGFERRDFDFENVLKLEVVKIGRASCRERV